MTSADFVSWQWTSMENGKDTPPTNWKWLKRVKKLFFLRSRHQSRTSGVCHILPFSSCLQICIFTESDFRKTRVRFMPWTTFRYGDFPPRCVSHNFLSFYSLTFGNNLLLFVLHTRFQRNWKREKWPWNTRKPPIPYNTYANTYARTCNFGRCPSIFPFKSHMAKYKWNVVRTFHSLSVW